MRDCVIFRGVWLGVASPGEVSGPKDSEGMWLKAQHRVGGSFWMEEGGVGGAAGATERQ